MFIAIAIYSFFKFLTVVMEDLDDPVSVSEVLCLKNYKVLLF